MPPSHSRRPHAPSVLFLPPSTLHWRYHLEHESGRGGCARVYRAWDTREGKLVALKQAHMSHKHGETICYEAELLSGLHHPAIPAFVEYFEEGGRSYLVEEWRDGTVMKHLRYFDLQHVLWIGLCCCDVLEYLHQHHLVHRDLTPGNVLLDMERKTLSLLDFGLARLDRPSPHFHAAPGRLPLTAGTPGYVAPEQWKDGMVTTAADIYSLGMLLGCALTDCQPEAVLAAQSFCLLWDDPQDIPTEILFVLALLDRMITPQYEERPTLTEVARLLSLFASW